MREGWKYKKLGVVATFINGYPFKPSEWGEEGRPIIRIQNLNNPDAPYNLYNGAIDNKYIVSKGDVLISWSGSLGVYEWGNDTDALLNQHIFKVVFNKEKINKSFFKYAVSSRISEMKGKVHGITMQHITKGDFDKTPIPVPSLSEQERIVAELDLLTDVIDKQKQQLKELDTLAQSIFYDMFGNPVVKKDNGWAYEALQDVCSRITDGSHFSPKEDEEGIYPMLSVKDMAESCFMYDNCKYISKTDYLTLVANGCKPFINDVLVAKDGSYLKTAFVQKEEKEQVLLSSIAILRPNTKVLHPEYLAFFFKTADTKTVVEKHYLTGTAIKRVILKGFRDLHISLPPIALQQSFAKKIEAIEKHKEIINKSIAETQKLFDYTMDKYFG